MMTRPSSLNAERGVQQLVRADDDVDRACAQPLANCLEFALGAQPRNRFDLHGPIGKPIAETLVMLLREQRRRHQDRHLLAVLHGDERRAHRDFGLAETDVAADQPIHRLRARQIGDDFVDRATLIRRHVERKLIDEALVVVVGLGQRGADARFAMRVDVQQFRGDVVDFFGSASLGFVPLVGTEPMQRRVRFVGAAVARDQMQRGDGNVELRLVGIFDRQEFRDGAVDLERAQARDSDQRRDRCARPARRCAVR